MLLKKAPIRVLFCGLHQTFTLLSIAPTRHVWYLTNNYFEAQNYSVTVL